MAVYEYGIDTRNPADVTQSVDLVLSTAQITAMLAALAADAAIAVAGNLSVGYDTARGVFYVTQIKP